jgi:hypothetical protein
MISRSRYAIPAPGLLWGKNSSQLSEFSVRRLTPNRLMSALLITGMLLLVLPLRVIAQDTGDTPLGDVARNLRKKTAASGTVIDNDNLSKVVDDAASQRAAGSSPVFSLDPSGRGFHVSSPDVTCSLSFSGKASSLLSDPLMLDELPRSEMAKLEGPATIDGDSLQVTVHNGTSWELREVVIGLTIVKQPGPAGAATYFGQAHIVPAVASGASQQVQSSFQKQPDVTLLLRVKGSAAPSTTAIFRTSLNFSLFPDQEWHWAIVKAKGVPPQTSPEAATIDPNQGAGQLPPGTRQAGAQAGRPNPDAATH